LSHLENEGATVFPIEFYCPITLAVMRDPYIDPEGNAYEKSAIETWLLRKKESPLTRSFLCESYLLFDHERKTAIDAFVLNQQPCTPTIDLTLPPH
jgi:hypothetical protein